MNTDVLSLLCCPSCFKGDLTPETGLRSRLRCGDCSAAFPMYRGIPDLVRPGATIEGKKPRISLFFSMVSNLYDLFTPAISGLVWRCSPLEYRSMVHRAVGQGRKGRLLDAPTGTGAMLTGIEDYVREVPTVVAVDISWQMLLKAKRRFEKRGLRNITLIRADVEALPFHANTFDAVMCANGLHSFTDRTQAIKELKRVAQRGGRILGSTLVRGMQIIGDRVLDLYQSSGLFERLVSVDYMLADLKRLELEHFTHYTRGSILFFEGYKATCDETDNGSDSDSAGAGAEKPAISPEM